MRNDDLVKKKKKDLCQSRRTRKECYREANKARKNFQKEGWYAAGSAENTTPIFLFTPPPNWIAPFANISLNISS